MTTPTLRRRLVALLLLACTAALGAGCAALPQNGPVHRAAGEPASSAPEEPYFDPPGPAAGASRTDIVKGFLVAMQANPINSGAARGFLSEHASASWKPDDGTIVYDTSAVDQRGSAVVARFSDTHRLDADGTWAPGPNRTTTLHFRMVREHGQWRIDNPMAALLVRTSYFEAQYVPYDLYFFDNTEKVLVPETVYIAQGQATATSLVRGLLRGPDAQLAPAAHTAFPTDTSLEPSVAVTDSGVAEVPLGPGVLKLSPSELDRVLLQLAWTLTPVPGVARVRITVNGTPVALPDGRTDFTADDGSEFAPTGLGTTPDLIGIRGGRVVTVGASTVQPVAGAFGKRGLALRSVALGRSGATIAAVSQSGTTAYVASATATGGGFERVLDTGHDLLRPVFDLDGTLWLVDRTQAGAVVHLAHDGRTRVISVPGVSGHAITSFALSPDGTRLAVGLQDGVRPEVLVDTVVRGPAGAVQSVRAGLRLPLSEADPAHRLGPVVDVGWRTPTMVAALTRPSATTSRVVYAMSDGSPGGNGLVQPDPVTATGAAIVVDADEGLPLLLLDGKGRLERLDLAGKWDTRSTPSLVGAAYAQ